MTLAVVILFVYCIYLHFIKAPASDIPCELRTRLDQVSQLYIQFNKPMVEEYMTLKGYKKRHLYSDTVDFLDEQVYDTDGQGIEYKDYIVVETIKYSKLPYKLEQLKRDMKRGCEIFCKENE